MNTHLTGNTISTIIISGHTLLQSTNSRHGFVIINYALMIFPFPKWNSALIIFSTRNFNISRIGLIIITRITEFAIAIACWTTHASTIILWFWVIYRSLIGNFCRMLYRIFKSLRAVKTNLLTVRPWNSSISRTIIRSMNYVGWSELPMDDSSHIFLDNLSICGLVSFNVKFIY
jgi:hypothetical protein